MFSFTWHIAHGGDPLYGDCFGHCRGCFWHSSLNFFSFFSLLHPWGQGDKTHYQLVQGCNNVSIVRKIITTIITMIFLTIMIFLLQTDGGGRGQSRGGEWERKHVGDWSEDYLLRWTQWYLSTLLFSYWYDKVSANTASWFPKCYKKSAGSHDARSESPDMPN